MTTLETINKKLAIHKKREKPTLPPIDALKNGAQSWEKLARILYESIEDESSKITDTTIKKIRKLSETKPQKKSGRTSAVFNSSVKYDLANLCRNVKSQGNLETDIAAARLVASVTSPDVNNKELTEKIAQNLAKRMRE